MAEVTKEQVVEFISNMSVLELSEMEFDVILTSFGDKKINVIKEVRAITGLGLKEAKEFVESCPKAVKEGVSTEEAEEILRAHRRSGPFRKLRWKNWSGPLYGSVPLRSKGQR